METSLNFASSPPTIAAALTAAAATHGYRRAYIDDGQQYSFRSMEDSAGALAARLAAAGIVRGDRIAVIVPNQIEWLLVFFAAARLGAVIVGMSVRYRDTELDYMLSDSKATMVIALPEYAGYDYRLYFSAAEADGRLPDLRQLIFLAPRAGHALAPFAGLGGSAAPASATEAEAGTAAGPDDLMMIIYTSGTTGRPKAAGLTHRSMLATASAQARHIRAVPDDLIQLANPLNHVGGITCGILTFLLAGATCELVPVFKAEIVLEMAARRPPTVISGVPTMLTLLLRHPNVAEADFSSVRLVFMGGANVDGAILERLQQVMPGARLMNLYGMTETSGAIVMTPWECGQDDLLRSIGQPLPGAQVRVVGVDGQPVAQGGVGELWFKGLGVIPGYAGAQHSQQAFDGDGWLHSGDLACVDQRGFVFLMGRDKDMYIQGGFNVYPVEVEGVLASHPAVMLAAGVGVPDPVLGQVGRYYVVPKEGAGITEQDLIEYCRAHLADYKVPRQVVFRQQLPMTPAGKIQKSTLRGESPAGAGNLNGSGT